MNLVFCAVLGDKNAQRAIDVLAKFGRKTVVLSDQPAEPGWIGFFTYPWGVNFSLLPVVTAAYRLQNYVPPNLVTTPFWVGLPPLDFGENLADPVLMIASRYDRWLNQEAGRGLPWGIPPKKHNPDLEAWLSKTHDWLKQQGFPRGSPEQPHLHSSPSDFFELLG